MYNQIEGATPFISDGGSKLTVNEDAYTKVTDMTQKWVKNGWLNKGLDYATAQTLMFTGKAGYSSCRRVGDQHGAVDQGAEVRHGAVPQLFDKPATQADSHTFILPRKDRTPEQRKAHMLFIKQMLEQSLTWAQGGHVPAYLPTYDSTAYKKLTPQSNYYASAAESAVFDGPGLVRRLRIDVREHRRRSARPRPAGQQLPRAGHVGDQGPARDLPQHPEPAVTGHVPTVNTARKAR